MTMQRHRFLLYVNGELCEFLSGTTRVFRLNDRATDSAIVEKEPADGRQRHHRCSSDAGEAGDDGADGSVMLVLGLGTQNES
jgi:hypothetical protein